MRKFPLALVAGALAGCATIDDTAPPPPQLTAQQIVEARQAAFHMSGAAMGNMRAAIERDADPKSQVYAARGVARWARALPTLFPDSTRTMTPSRARPEIWGNKADFEAKAAAYAAAAERLAVVAASGDKTAFAEQHRVTAATCKACHDLYQVPQNRGS